MLTRIKRQIETYYRDKVERMRFSSTPLLTDVTVVDGRPYIMRLKLRPNLMINHRLGATYVHVHVHASANDILGMTLSYIFSMLY